MKSKTKEVYYCEHCNKHGLSKVKMEYHEKVCSKNPANDRPCFHCIHLDKNTTKIYGEYYNGEEWSRQVDLLCCNKKDVFLYTPKNQIKGNQFDLGDEVNEPMPIKCEIFESHSNDISELFLGCR